jgi:restriction system protein
LADLRYRNSLARYPESERERGSSFTTGVFSSDAIDSIGNIDPKVVLIDGRHLAEFMIDFGLGVTEASLYQIKRIDSDYFGEE